MRGARRLAALDEYSLANEVVVATDGEQALDYLYYHGKFMRRAYTASIRIIDVEQIGSVLQHLTRT